MIRRTLTKIVSEGEEGHGAPLPAALLGGVGAVLLAIGAANDTDVLTIVGGIVLAVGLVAMQILNHITVEYGIFSRLDDIEKESGGN
ncbi:MAG: hypothetical protein IIC88_06170 [Chloroflexi bacterium]|nr:hypothetical protein [Chloroflexota bacterium]